MADIEVNLAQRLAQIDRRYKDLRREVILWGKESLSELGFAIARLDLQQRIQLEEELRLRDSLSFKIKSSQGRVEAISFQFARKGIFLERGVGKGRKVGSALAELHKRPWLAPTLHPRVERLADTLVEQYADIIADTVQLNIPGVLRMEVKKT